MMAPPGSPEDGLEAVARRLRAVEGRVRHWHNLLFHLQAALQPSGGESKVPLASPPILQSDVAPGSACLEAALRSLEHLSATWELQDLSDLRTQAFSCCLPTSGKVESGQ